MDSLNNSLNIRTVCSFFGHRDCPDDLLPVLENQITHLILHYHVNLFYVGHEGNFDLLALHVLKNMKEKFDWIDYAVIQAYFHTDLIDVDQKYRLFPEVLEGVHPRFAMDRRNRWMVDQADFLIVYVKRDWGGAAKYTELAMRRGKQVFNLAK